MNTLVILIANILLSGLLIEVFFNHNNAKNQETKLYSKMLIINFISSVIAIFTIIIFKSLNLNFLTIIMKKIELVLNLLILSLFLYNRNFIRKLANLLHNKIADEVCIFEKFVSILFIIFVVITTFWFVI